MYPLWLQTNFLTNNTPLSIFWRERGRQKFSPPNFFLWRRMKSQKVNYLQWGWGNFEIWNPYLELETLYSTRNYEMYKISPWRTKGSLKLQIYEDVLNNTTQKNNYVMMMCKQKLYNIVLRSYLHGWIYYFINQYSAIKF